VLGRRIAGLAARIAGDECTAGRPTGGFDAQEAGNKLVGLKKCRPRRFLLISANNS
jgi:hypothetical protein